MGMPMYMPYGMPPPPYPGMPPHPMYSHEMSYGGGKENMMPPHMSHPYGKPMSEASVPTPSTGSSSTNKVPLAPKPSEQKTPMSYSPKKKQSSDEDDNMSTPFINMSITPSSRREGYLSVPSSRKSIFDSPKLGAGLSLESPGGLNIHGMTPLSSLKDTFATPYGSAMFSALSPEENLCLNKALFADERTSKTLLAKTPVSSKMPREMKLRIGGNEDSMSSFISDMQYNRVSISPLSCKTPKMDFKEPDEPKSAERADKTPPRSVSRSIKFADERDDDGLDSVSKIHSLMPSVTATEDAQTPRNVTNNVTQDSIDSRDICAASPFDASLTPIGSYDQGFWGNQLGFSPQNSTSFTPFKSPGISLSTKKERRPLSNLSFNTIHNKPSSTKKKASVKAESETTPKRQKRTEVTAQE
jgi:hypothetical protein